MQAQEDSRFLLASNRKFKGLTKEEEGLWNGSFYFLQLADTQLGFFTENKNWDEEMELMERTVEYINSLQNPPKFVIVCGDLIHAWPTDFELTEKQVYDYKRIMSKINKEIPLLCLCGNHDVGNTPDRASIQLYCSRFGDDYYSFWAGGVFSVVINANLYSDPSNAQDLYDEQLEWLEKELQENRKQKNKEGSPVHLFMFQHQPWFLTEPEEEDEYFNIPMVRRLPALQMLEKYHFDAVFAGHYHRNSYGKMGDMEMITTSAVGRPLGKDPSGFRIVKVFRDHIQHYYVGIDHLPSSISLDDTPTD